MKTLTDILTEAIRSGLDAQRDADDFGYWDIDDNCIDTHAFSAEALAKHVAAAYREARTITTRDGLNALPEDTVIIDSFNRAEDSDYNPTPQVKTRFDDDGPDYWTAGDTDYAPVLPAFVLWLPEEAS